MQLTNRNNIAQNKNKKKWMRLCKFIIERSRNGHGLWILSVEEREKAERDAFEEMRWFSGF